MATFPSYARILVDGFGEQRESALLRTEMESGPPRQARVRYRVLVTRPVQIYFESLADYDAFVVWFRDTLHEGADWFDWTDPVRGTVKQGRFNGDGIEAIPVAGSNDLWVIRSLKIEVWGN
jgi:hypothetical protein